LTNRPNNKHNYTIKTRQTRSAKAWIQEQEVSKVACGSKGGGEVTFNHKETKNLLIG